MVIGQSGVHDPRVQNDIEATRTVTRGARLAAPSATQGDRVAPRIAVALAGPGFRVTVPVDADVCINAEEWM